MTHDDQAELILGSPLGESTPKKKQLATCRKDFLCTECGSIYRHATTLHAHCRRKHGLGRQRYTCNICSKQFMNKTDFQSHVNKHMHIRPFECQSCNKAYYCKRNLTRHTLVCKKQVQPHLCTVCQKKCTSARLLMQHLVSHEVTRSFTCSKCQRQFKHRQSLTRHQRSRCPMSKK